MTRPLRDVFGEWPYSLSFTDEQREALRAAIDKQELPPLSDQQVKDLVSIASKGGMLARGGNTSSRIVKAVERYHGVHETEALCPLCGEGIAKPPCSANSDGAFHLSHPHNPSRTPRLFRFSGGA